MSLHVGVDPEARDPEERAAVDLADVDRALVAAREHRAGRDGVERDAELAREVVAAPAGEDAERAVRPAQRRRRPRRARRRPPSSPRPRRPAPRPARAPARARCRVRCTVCSTPRARRRASTRGKRPGGAAAAGVGFTMRRRRRDTARQLARTSAARLSRTATVALARHARQRARRAGEHERAVDPRARGAARSVSTRSPTSSAAPGAEPVQRGVDDRRGRLADVLRARAPAAVSTAATHGPLPGHGPVGHGEERVAARGERSRRAARPAGLAQLGVVEAVVRADDDDLRARRERRCR